MAGRPQAGHLVNLCDMLPASREWQGQAFCLLTELSLVCKEGHCCERVPEFLIHSLLCFSTPFSHLLILKTFVGHLPWTSDCRQSTRPSLLLAELSWLL